MRVMCGLILVAALSGMGASSAGAQTLSNPTNQPYGSMQSPSPSINANPLASTRSSGDANSRNDNPFPADSFTDRNPNRTKSQNNPYLGLGTGGFQSGR